ncbi:SPOR domain-containing protein [Rufibacter sediminis]|uniref:SPOR domain-containing protein n=1 Tax=Rufibacter sediminis TaxID=2762756 RepID=A0ABR6VRC2_9BACT|nr:SPOR domain-containing protein [Rufibacter sediminis]MBC3539750.1 SPOR domain-containing protein [Rufibacter sediminis]
MVQSHIKSLLYAYDCVIIPNFGGLITHYVPAKIHPVKHMFSPPSKRIAFNEQLKANDGLLISTLAQKQKWPMPQAQLAVAEFVVELKEQLRTQHRFELQDVGVFRYNAEHKLVFENLENDNFLEQAFGLPELVAKPIAGKETLILRGKYQDQAAQATDGKKVGSKFRKLYRVGAGLVIGCVSVATIYLLSLQGDMALSSLNPVTLLTGTETTTSSPEATPETPDVDAFEQAQLTEQYKSALPVEPSLEAELAAEDSLLAAFPKTSPKTEPEASSAPEVSLEDKEEAPVAAAPVVKEKALAKADKPVTVKAEEKAPEAESSTIKRKTGRFYIIMGVFDASNGYAVMNQKRLQKKGFTAKIITSIYDTKRQRVSVADFASETDAFAALPALRAKISNELWVYNY